VVEPIVADHDLELDDLTVIRAGGRRVVRVMVDGDGPDGHGPSLDDIAEVSRRISVALDDAEPDDGRPYVLEVSSRGVDRPLTRPAHWRRNTGRLVAVTKTDGTALLGRIGSSDEAAAQLWVAGDPVDLPFVGVAKAVVQVELNRPLDPHPDDDATALEEL
jgi:ribosome maturation factor RimP